MRASLSEKKIVIVLFVMVFITFSFAHEDSKKLQQLYSGTVSSATSHLASLKNASDDKTDLVLNEVHISENSK